MGNTADSPKQRFEAYQKLDRLRQRITTARIDRAKALREYAQNDKWVIDTKEMISFYDWWRSAQQPGIDS